MNISGIVDGVASHAAATGLFDAVNTHEPKNAPGNGLTCAIWADRIGPMPVASGLAATTSLVIVNARIYTSMLQQPYDAIDVNVMGAVDTLFTAYTGDFTLGGAVRNIDVLGQTGTALMAQAGYINQDGKVYRVMTITVPMIVNDAWEQVA